MKKISKLSIVALAVASLALSMIGLPAFAANDPFCDDSLRGTELWETMGCNKDPKDANEVFSSTVVNIINAVLGIIGVVAVIFIVYGGFLYLTSAGDSSKVKKGKDALMYAIIGLVIVGLAYAIVNFVVINIINAA